MGAHIIDDGFIRHVLETVAEQIEPDLSKLEEALGAPIDAGDFTLGVMLTAFAMQGVNLVEAVAFKRLLFTEFMDRCRERPLVVREEYRDGVLTLPVDDFRGFHIAPGARVRYRPISQVWSEILLGRGQSKWVTAETVQPLASLS